MKRALIISALILSTIGLGGCPNDAQVATQNLATAADNFELNRRIVFYNGITNEYILTIEGLCSLLPETGKLVVVCKTGPRSYKRHQLGLSHNVTYFSEQLEEAKASVYFYRVTFKPSVIIPAVEVR